MENGWKDSSFLNWAFLEGCSCLFYLHLFSIYVLAFPTESFEAAALTWASQTKVWIVLISLPVVHTEHFLNKPCFLSTLKTPKFSLKQKKVISFSASEINLSNYHSTYSFRAWQRAGVPPTPMCFKGRSLILSLVYLSAKVYIISRKGLVMFTISAAVFI